MNNITAEATRVTIQHGGFELQVFQLCDESLWEQYGQYRLSQAQVLERIDEATNWITRLHSDRPIILKALQGEGFTGIQLKVKFKEEGSRGWKTAKTLSISDSTEVWWHFSFDGNKKAKAILKASTEETIERRADAKFKQTRTEEEYEQRTANRILRQNEPYAALYKKDMCETAFEWFGCQFYWSYFYCWMTDQERCDLDKLNPPIDGKRKTKIHQWIEPETKERLRDKAIELRTLVLTARSRSHFIELFQNRYGNGWQMSIFE